MQPATRISPIHFLRNWPWNWLSIFFIVFSAYTVFRFGYYSVQWPGMTPNDYAINHRAAERFLNGQELYQPNDPSPYKYSPTFVFFFVNTLNRLPIKTAWFLWCILSIVPFFVGFYRLLTRAFPKITTLELQPALLILFSLAAFWHGYLEHFSYGQVDFILFALWLMAFDLDCSNDDSTSRNTLISLLISASLLIKPQSAILLAFFLMQRKFKLLALTTLLTVILLFLPYPFWGGRLFVYFAQWKNCIEQQSIELLTGNLNQSLAAVLARISHHTSSMMTWAKGFIALGASACIVFTYRKPLEASVEAKARLFCVCASLYLVLSPLSWRWLSFYWLPLGVVLGMDAFNGGKENRVLRAVLYFAFALSLLLNKNIALHFGLEDTEPLSYWGFYGAINLLLLSGALFSLFQIQKRKGRIQSDLS
jgi:hypothetical protein